MFEATVTYTRQNLNEDFFIFDTKNMDLLTYHAQIRNDLLKADGFISMSFIISSDKLSLTAVTLWDSASSAENFSSLNTNTFNRLLNAYVLKNGIAIKSTRMTLPDTAAIKAQKHSTRMTISEATTELISILGDPDE